MDERQLAYETKKWAQGHRTELVRDLSELITIPSVADYCDKRFPAGFACACAADLFMDYGRKYGLLAEHDDYYSASILLPGVSNEKELGILGHLDVVAAGEDWKNNPFHPMEKNGYLTGRGSLDNKGPLLMALYALRCLKELGVPLFHTIRLIAGCDEEKEMRDIQHYLSRHNPPEFTLVCDGAWPLCAGEKGILSAEISLKAAWGNLICVDGGNSANQVPAHASAKLLDADPETLKQFATLDEDINVTHNQGHIIVSVRGKEAHSSTPSKGKNAILILLEMLCRTGFVKGNTADKLEKLLKCFSDMNGTGLHIYYADRISGQTTCVPTGIHMTNDTLTLRMDIRYAVTQNHSVLLKNLKKRCSDLGFQLQILKHDKPVIYSLDDPVHQMLLQTARKHLSRKCKPYITGGGTYARFFPHAIPYGPAYLNPLSSGKCGEPHSANEGVSIDDLLEALKVYVITITKLDRCFANGKA